MGRLWWILLVASLGLGGAAPGQERAPAEPRAPTGGSGMAPGVQEINECLQANLPEATSLQTVRLESVDRTGSERTLHAKIFWKRGAENRSMILVKVEAPPDVRGSSYLVVDRAHGRDMFVYLPELKKVRRIHPRTASGSLFGTDFSYEDVSHLQEISGSGTATRLPDDRLAERDVAVVELIPDDEALSAYQRIVYFIDRNTCVPLKVQFYEASDSLHKLLTADPATLEPSGGGWVVRSVAIQDLKNETETRLLIDAIEIDQEIPDRLFTTRELERSGR